MDNALQAYINEVISQSTDPILREQVTFMRWHDIPEGYLPEFVWLDRGYKPRKGEYPHYVSITYSATTRPFDERILEYGLDFIELWRFYSLAQCRKIRGKKAQARRDAYHQSSGTEPPPDILTGAEPMLGGRG